MRRLMSFLRRRIGSLDLGWLYPPQDYVSNATIHGLSRYTGLAAADVRHICVVGVHNGDEVPPFLRRYPQAHVWL